MLVAGYTLYVIFMKFNVQIEQAFKTQLQKHKNIVRVIAIEEPEEVSNPEFLLKHWCVTGNKTHTANDNEWIFYELRCLFHLIATLVI